ncbi:hypothetical protein ACFX1W_022532 [Malus domestica]
MKRRALVKGRGPARITTQQGVFELKHKVVIAMNKLADRDTYQLGVEELEQMAECLTPDGFAPFLSCILDMDSEQKSAMVASIVKRLRDPDSVVRDACVETVGVLASKLINDVGEGDGVFVVLVRHFLKLCVNKTGRCSRVQHCA